MLRTVVIAAVAGYAAADVLAFVGTGNCDGEDKTCVEGPVGPEQVIRPLFVLGNGSMFMYGNEKLNIPTGGAPVWLTTKGKSLVDGCLFATLADKSTIFSYGFGGKESTKPVVHVTPSGGVNPVYASVTENGKTLLVANYHGPDDSKVSEGASAASFQIGADCSLTLADVKNHSGSSVNPKRQGGAHVHSFQAARGGFAYACDLGMDEIFTYAVAGDGKLTEVHRTKTEPGVGPRHIVQHPSAPFVYVVTEMGQSVLVYKQQADGALEFLQTQSLGKGAGSKSAEIAITPDGSFVFATNRGVQNTVTSFKTLKDGKLASNGVFDAPKFPRGMALVDDGAILLVGGQSQTEVWSYRVEADGHLKRLSEIHPTGPNVNLPPHPATFTTFGSYSPERLLI